MKCPRCGKDMFKSSSHVFCSHCGYLDDGKQIRGYTEEQASDLEIYLGNDYDSIVRNNNAKSCFFLGPLYFLVRGFLFFRNFFASFRNLYLVSYCSIWRKYYFSFSWDINY